MTMQILWRARPSFSSSLLLQLRRKIISRHRSSFHCIGAVSQQQQQKQQLAAKRNFSVTSVATYFHHRNQQHQQQPLLSLNNNKKRIRTPLHLQNTTRATTTTRSYSSSSTSSNDDNNNNPTTPPPPPSCMLPYLGLPSYPDNIELEIGQRLIAIGDVHGDFTALLEALHIAGVVVQENEEGSFVWTGDNAIVIQIGDVLDRGPHELQCWQLLVELSRQAQQTDGKIILLHGNHELWTSIGFYQLDHERYMENLDYDDGIDDTFEIEFGKHLDESLEPAEGGETCWRSARVANDLITTGITLNPRKVAARWAAMEPGGLLSKDFLSLFKIAIKVGDTILVHAGIVPEHLDRYQGISGMNESTKRWILKKGPRVGRQHMFVPPNDPEGRLRTYVQSMPDFFMEGDDNAHSPIWMRDYSDPRDDIPHNPTQAYEMLDTVLRRLEASRMVVGHTPQSRINAIRNGKAWRIDVGMSRGMEGTYPEVLEVMKGPDGNETVWVITAEGRVKAEERYIIDDDEVIDDDHHPSASD